MKSPLVADARSACAFAAGVEGELAQELAGGGVDDADVQVMDEHQDAGSGVGPSDADVVEPAGVAEGELAVGVDAVGAAEGMAVPLTVKDLRPLRGSVGVLDREPPARPGRRSGRQGARLKGGAARPATAPEFGSSTRASSAVREDHDHAKVGQARAEVPPNTLASANS